MAKYWLKLDTVTASRLTTIRSIDPLNKYRLIENLRLICYFNKNIRTYSKCWRLEGIIFFLFSPGYTCYCFFKGQMPYNNVYCLAPLWMTSAVILIPWYPYNFHKLYFMIYLHCSNLELNDWTINLVKQLFSYNVFCLPLTYWMIDLLKRNYILTIVFKFKKVMYYWR